VTLPMPGPFQVGPMTRRPQVQLGGVNHTGENVAQALLCVGFRGGDQRGLRGSCRLKSDWKWCCSIGPWPGAPR